MLLLPGYHPTLYMKKRTGKIMTWSIKAMTDEFSRVIIRTSVGYVGGKIKVTPKIITKGKNIGRANETTPFEQACSQARSKWNKQLDKGYTEDPSGESDLRLPMLAQPWAKAGHRMQFPAIAQPKLNGVRCFATKVNMHTIMYTSRMGKPFTTLDHLTPYLLKIMMVGEIFDGEIYVHLWSFNRIIKAVKKQREDSLLLQFHCYDIAVENTTNAERDRQRQNRIPADHPFIVYVESAIIKSKIYVEPIHDRLVKQGYEGVIIRSIDGLYHFGYRSADLLKFKKFFDTEFTIVGGNVEEQHVMDERGNIVATLECVVFEVHCKDYNVTFDMRPRGTHKQRAAWYADLPNLIGKKITGRWQERSPKNVPIFPVGIAIRDYE